MAGTGDRSGGSWVLPRCRLFLGGEACPIDWFSPGRKARCGASRREGRGVHLPWSNPTALRSGSEHNMEPALSSRRLSNCLIRTFEYKITPKSILDSSEIHRGVL